MCTNCDEMRIELNNLIEETKKDIKHFDEIEITLRKVIVAILQNYHDQSKYLFDATINDHEKSIHRAFVVNLAGTLKPAFDFMNETRNANMKQLTAELDEMLKHCILHRDS